MTSDELSVLFSPCDTPDSLDLWLQTFLKIKVPRTAVCPNHSAPFDYLWRAYKEPAVDLTIWAPRGGGKTRLAAAATLLDLLHKPGLSVRILGGSLEQSLRMWDHLLPDIQRLNVGMRQGLHNCRKVATSNSSNAAVLTQSQRAVRGLRVQKLRCDEVDMFDPKVWSAAQLTTKSLQCTIPPHPDSPPPHVSGTVEALSTCHRPTGPMSDLVDKSHKNGTLIKWCLMEVLENCPKDRVCATCPLFDECKGRAKEECHGFFSIDDAIKMKQRVSKETWETEMMCLRPSITGAVFPHFDESIHVLSSSDPSCLGASVPSSLSDLWLGIDFGFNDPFVCLWIQRDDQDRIYVIDEYVQSSRTTDEHIEEIARRKWGDAKNIACDPAGDHRNDQTARSNTDLLTKAGYRVHKKSSYIIPGVEKVRAAVMTGAGKTRLSIHPRCKRLIAAMKGYHYPDKGGEQPAKDGVHDHLIDALRYYFVNFTRGEKIGTGNY